MSSYPKTEPTQAASGLLQFHVQPLGQRRINVETAQKFGYGLSKLQGETVHVANYRDNAGRICAQKIRSKQKDFSWAGEPKGVGLFGQHLWKEGGRRVIVTEGELDALSVAQVLNLRWPVVSVPNGAASAKLSFLRNLEWLESFNEVVILFDQDEPGRKAAAECASLLSPNRAKLGVLPLKDANEMLVAGRSDELVRACWEAKTWRPDGIVEGDEVWQLIQQPDPPALPYPYPGLNTLLGGIRGGEIVTFCAGSGIGKSTVCREIAHSLILRGQKVGYIALEESVKVSAKGLIGISQSTPPHLLDPTEEAWRELEKGVVFYDHFGSTDSDNLLSKIRYMARACGCQWIVLDHLSIVVSGMDVADDERKTIDRTMTMMRSLVEELGVGLLLVSHLKRRQGGGKGYEEGAMPRLSDLRGSAGIEQLSDVVIGLGRDQTNNQDIAEVRVLKNRPRGNLGQAGWVKFHEETGRLLDCQPEFEAVAASDF